MKDAEKLHKYLEKWMDLLCIDDVSIGVDIGSKEDHSELKDAVAFTIYSSQPHRAANIIVRKDQLKTKSLEHTVFHELLHVLTGDMREIVYKYVKQKKHRNLFDDLEEKLVLTLERAIASILKKRRK